MATSAPRRSERKLRVLLAITRLTVGGDTNVVIDIGRRFRNHPRIEAEIAAGPVPADEVDLTHLGRENQIPTWIVPTLSNSSDPRRMLAAIRDLRRLMRRRQYDIVHTHSSAAGILGRMAAASAGVPVRVHHVHGWGLQEGMSLPMRAAYLTLERWCARFTDRLIAVSNATFDDGLRLRVGPASRFAVIYNGIDTARFSREDGMPLSRSELGLEEGCKVVGMIGRLERQKNPLDFIRTAALVISRNERARFLIIGDGRLRPDCERLIESLGLGGRCVLLGFRDDVQRILPLLDVVASTSLWEGLPVTMQEAMCAGKPIVANAVNGVGEVVRQNETGFLVAPHDVGAMAEGILRLLDDEPLCRRLGARARIDAARFSTGRMLDEIEALYEELAGRGVHIEVVAGSLQQPRFAPRTVPTSVTRFDSR